MTGKHHRPGCARLSKREWQAKGGLKNSRLFRVMRSGVWQYWEDLG